MVVNYRHAKIYIIRNHIDDSIYIGSTTQALSARLAGHKSEAKKAPERKKNKHWNEIGLENIYIELLEDYPCERLEQLMAREGYHQRMHKNQDGFLNMRIEQLMQAGKKVYDRQNYQENKEEILARNKAWTKNNGELSNEIRRNYRANNRDEINGKEREYYQENIEHIRERKRNNPRIKEIIKCECGVELARRHIARHRKSLTHISNMENSERKLY